MEAVAVKVKPEAAAKEKATKTAQPTVNLALDETHPGM